MKRAILASAVLWVAATAAGYDNVKVHPLFNSLALARTVEKLQKNPSRPELAAYDFAPGQVGWATWTMALKPVPEPLPAPVAPEPSVTPETPVVPQPEAAPGQGGEECEGPARRR